MGSPFDFHEFDVLDQLSLTSRGCVRWQDAVVITVNNHGGHIITGNVLAEVFDPRVDTSDGADRGGADGDGPIRIHDMLADPLSVLAPYTVEVLQELSQRGWPVRLKGGFGLFETLAVDTFRIVSCLDEKGTNRANQH